MTLSAQISSSLVAELEDCTVIFMEHAIHIVLVSTVGVGSTRYNSNDSHDVTHRPRDRCPRIGVWYQTIHMVFHVTLKMVESLYHVTYLRSSLGCRCLWWHVLSLPHSLRGAALWHFCLSCHGLTALGGECATGSGDPGCQRLWPKTPRIWKRTNSLGCSRGIGVAEHCPHCLFSSLSSVTRFGTECPVLFWKPVCVHTCDYLQVFVPFFTGICRVI